MVSRPRKQSARPLVFPVLAWLAVHFSWAASSFAPAVHRPSQAKRVACAVRGAEAEFSKGDMVKALCPDDDTWYPGVVESLKDDRYVVKWDDPDGGPETHSIVADDIKKIITFQDYKVGEAVHALFPEDGHYYPAQVTKINDDGTFTVKWEDPDGGPEESEMEPLNMKYPPIPISELEVGQKYTGTVRTVFDFGAFVDIGTETEGLLPVFRVSSKRVDNIEDYLRVEQEVEVWVRSIRDDGTFGLTMVEGTRADLTAFADLSPDEWHEAIVMRIVPYGAFATVVLEDGTFADGLVHLSQLQDGFANNIDDAVSVEDVVSVGQEVKVRVRSVDVDSGKMSLSMKGSTGYANAEKPSLAPFADMSSDTWVTGTVKRIAPYGAFVEISAEDGTLAEGLVHVTQIRHDLLENVDEELSVSHRVPVRVESVDLEEGTMLLSMK